MKSITSKAQSYIASLKESVGFSLNELKGTVLGAMSHRMSDADKELLLKMWHPDEHGRMSQASTESSSSSPECGSASASAPLPQADLQKAINGLADDNIFHPILGERIVQLGYKSLYLTNVRSLALAPIWKKQRILRPERAQLIVSDKIRNGLAKSISGTISFHKDNETGEIGIIDGQHRVGALMLLAQKGHWDYSERNVVVEVFPTASAKQVSALFREINAAEPVRLVDLLQAAEEEGEQQGEQQRSGPEGGDGLEEGSARAPEEEKEGPAMNSELLLLELNAAIDSLAALYPAMFKPSSRCKPPHLNVDVLRDDLFQSGFLQRHPVAASSAERLLRLLRRVNDCVASQGAATRAAAAGAGTTTASKSQAAADRKATEYGLYLGLDKAWLYVQYPDEAEADADLTRQT